MEVYKDILKYAAGDISEQEAFLIGRYIKQLPDNASIFDINAGEGRLSLIAAVTANTSINILSIAGNTDINKFLGNIDRFSAKKIVPIISDVNTVLTLTGKRSANMVLGQIQSSENLLKVFPICSQMLRAKGYLILKCREGWRDFDEQYETCLDMCDETGYLRVYCLGGNNGSNT